MLARTFHENFPAPLGPNLQQLRQHFDLEIPVTKIYRYPTISELSNYLEGGAQEIHYLNISNLSLCKSTNQISQSNEVYGVLPYMAPEILQKKNYTMASHIYSFGIVTYELVTGIPPYNDIPHDNDLVLNICQGLRPKIPSNVSPLLIKLITECWDAQPEKRTNYKKLFM
jgi:serine/threonine protein kinase